MPNRRKFAIKKIYGPGKTDKETSEKRPEVVRVKARPISGD